MRLAYQVATPEVSNPNVTAYRGDLRQAFALLASLGYHGVELMVRDPATVDAGAIETLSRAHGLPVSLVCTGEVFGEDGLSFTDPDAAVRGEARRRMRDAVALAARLGVDVNVGRLRGRLRDDVPRHTALAWAHAALREAADLAATAGIRVLIEPINRHFADWVLTTQEGLALLDELSHPALQLMLDVGHLYVEGEAFAAAFAAARAHSFYVHLCDHNRLAPGMGELDFAAILGGLRTADYQGWVSVEAFQQPDSETVMRQSAALLLPLLAG